MDEVARALAALARLEGGADAADDVPEQLTRFSVCSPSPLAPERVQVVAGRADAPAFALPRVGTASPLSDPARVQQQLQRAASPHFALERVGAFPDGQRSFLFASRAMAPSRTLAQMPMSAPRAELVPQRANMVLKPLELRYELRAIDAARAGADAGFSSALTKQDEYARGKMSNKPFAPGGNSLATPSDAAEETPVGQGVVSIDAFREKMVVSAVEQQRNALALTDDASLLADEALLDALVVDLPTTLGRSLGVTDAQTIERFHADRKTCEEEQDAQFGAHDEVETVGANPSGLLKPYFEVAGDAAHVAAIRSLVLDEKAASAMRATGNESATVGLDQLLRDLEDDGDLAELGFSVSQVDDEDEDDSAPGNAEVNEDSERVGEAPIPSTPGVQTREEESKSSVEPEVELEALLNDDPAASRVKKVVSASGSGASTEWASIASVDVRNFHEKVPEMAIYYDFELDVFQKECVVHLERHECVFVAAHTSAGKTVVAEYAIAMSQKHMTRTIYTSPIKALSNQKYRDFRSKFGADNVGLITGDVSINPEASCLVMTTEILRSMLYRGADVIRDIEWVIFDEIHYINDSERGVVWEEVIIMLPEHIGMVFLSATTPNHLEFSDWIGRTKKKKIHVISTLKRPVPLQHFLYAGKELFKLYDASSGYLAGAYTSAKNKLFPPPDKMKTSPSGGGRGGRGGRGGAPSRGGGSMANARSLRTSGGDQSEWTKLIQNLKEKALLPVVVFAFSKRLCEESASKLNKLDLSTPSERSEIHLFLEASIQRLQGSDRELPQVLTMKEMLKRGIGVHHGGLLPIIKEMVEILFGRGLVKVLFSTETFAMGVNMPARTVVFNGIRKHDGKGFRDLLPGEYTQMAGRAGRRGLDAVGTVIIACWNDVPEPTSLRTMLAGKATTLTSQFRLTYNMILNLLRVEVLTVEDMMKRSFSEFHTQKALASRKIPQLIARGRKLVGKLEQALVDEFPHLQETGELALLREFFELQRQKRELEKQLTAWVLTNDVQAAKAAIAPGRVVALNVKGLKASHPLGLVVRTNALSGDASGGGTTNRSKISFDSYQSADSTAVGDDKRVFKTITVICLCPEDFTPPKPEPVATPSAEKSAFGRPLGVGSAFGAPLRSKHDEDDALMFGRSTGKKSGSKRDNKDAAELESQTTGSLVGRTYAVLDLPESCIESVTALVATAVNTKTLVATSSKKELASAIEFLADLDSQTGETLHASLPLVDIVGELRVNDLEVATGYGRWQDLYSIVQRHPCASVDGGAAASSSQRGRVLGKLDKLFKLKQYVARMTRELSNDSLSLFPDFQQRLSVLKRLGYISEDGVVQVKGRVACEINTCEEIVLTEMIFENVLAALEPEEIVAVLSALIFQEKSQSEPTLTPRLETARDTVQKIAESLGVIQLEQRLDIDPAVFCKGALNFGLAEVVYEWARGMPFKQLCELTDVQEGSIVRCITRLDEVCREVRNAARVVGDPGLFRKMEVASEAIKRDVVFASSLYLA